MADWHPLSQPVIGISSELHAFYSLVATRKNGFTVDNVRWLQGEP